MIFYHVSRDGIEVEQAPKDAHHVIGTEETDYIPATFTDLRMAKRCFARISAAEIARLRALRKRVAGARTRGDLLKACGDEE